MRYMRAAARFEAGLGPALQCKASPRQLSRLAASGVVRRRTATSKLLGSVDYSSARSGTFAAMDVDDLVARAWAAVQKAGVPESLQGLALKEALDFLRSDTAQTGSGERRSAMDPRDQTERSRARERDPQPDASPGNDASVFFARLAHESGEKEQDLRDILQLTADGKVQVTPPTKDLGKNQAEQARTVIALVAGARSHGLGEEPVKTEAVRREAERSAATQRGISQRSIYDR